MQVSANDFDQLLREHHALLRAYRDVQARCSEQLRTQADTIARLQAQAMRLHAARIRSETALAWEKEDREALAQAIPGLPRRVALARQVTALQARIHELMRAPRSHGRPQALSGKAAPAEAPDALESSIAAADLVICQAGCISHGAYWRVQDHCKRTGKACVLVDKPDALRIVRIRRVEADGGAYHRVDGASIGAE